MFINSKPGTNQMFEPKSQRKTESLQIQQQKKQSQSLHNSSEPTLRLCLPLSPGTRRSYIHPLCPVCDSLIKLTRDLCWIKNKIPSLPY